MAVLRSVCFIAEDLSQSAGYEQLQWSFNLSVCLIASDLSRYAGYELFQWSYPVCLICPDPLGRAWLRACDAICIRHEASWIQNEWLMAHGEFASGEVLPSEKVTIHFYSWKIGLQYS